jgi:hypothetical protein
MKKQFLVLFIFLFIRNLLFSQVGGSGTFSDPYHGTVTVNTNWDPSFGEYENDIPTIYANDITVAPGVTLTISPGGTLSFFGGTYSLTISSGAAFVINPGGCVTVNAINNNGTLRIESDASESGAASLILNSYSGTRSTEIQLYMPGGPTGTGGYVWHYVSVPVSNVDAIAFNDYAPFPAFNLAQYIEPLVVDDNMSGWVTYDGLQYSTGNTVAQTFSTLTLGQGYNFYSDNSPTVTFTTSVAEGRLLNYIDRSRAITCSSSNPEARGWNLIGNPFTASLDWDYTVSNNSIPNIENAIYFTLNDQIATYINGVGTGGATGKIPPMQGFFVHATGASSIPLRHNALTHDPYQFRYKGTPDYGKSSDTISLARLNIENQNGKNDLVVRFNDKATASFDKLFDAYKLEKTNGALSIWTKSGDADYSINGLPFPGTSVYIPIGIYVSASGVYKISSTELKNLDKYSVSLKDIASNITVDLRKGETIEFNAPAGITEDRFFLVVTNLTTGITDNIPSGKMFSIYSSAGIVNILSLTDQFSYVSGDVSIYDLTGRLVVKQSDVVWQGKNDLKQILFRNAAKGIYIVEIKAGNKKYVEKVYLLK